MYPMLEVIAALTGFICMAGLMWGIRGLVMYWRRRAPKIITYVTKYSYHPKAVTTRLNTRTTDIRGQEMLKVLGKLLRFATHPFTWLVWAYVFGVFVTVGVIVLYAVLRPVPTFHTTLEGDIKDDAW